MIHARTRNWIAVLGGLMLIARAPAQSSHAGGHGGHPPMPGQSFVVRAWLDDGQGRPAVEQALRMGDPSSASAIEQTIQLPPSYGSVRILQFLPTAELRQTVSPTDTDRGASAIELAIEGPSQSFRRWLVAGDPERDRLISYIATWRYASVRNETEKEELFRQFEAELQRDPVVTLHRADRAATEAIAARDGEAKDFPSLDCAVRVVKFFPHFARSDGSQEPVNRSERRVNPAALIEISQGARREQRWVFAKFPEYSPPSAASLPIAVDLDCPQEPERPAPDIVVVSMPESGHESWIRSEGRIEKTTVLKDAVPIPGTQYGFKLVSHVPSGRLVESYVASLSGKGPAAIQFAWQPPDAAVVESWVELNKSRTLTDRAGRLTLSLAIDSPSVKEGHP